MLLPSVMYGGGLYGWVKPSLFRDDYSLSFFQNAHLFKKMTFLTFFKIITSVSSYLYKMSRLHNVPGPNAMVGYSYVPLRIQTYNNYYILKSPNFQNPLSSVLMHPRISSQLSDPSHIFVSLVFKHKKPHGKSTAIC